MTAAARLTHVLILPLTTLVLCSCAGGSPHPQSANSTVANWTAEYSTGVAVSPSGTSGFSFVFPEADGVHYVTEPSGSLANMAGIRVHYRIDADAGTQFIPKEVPTQPAFVTVYLQRAGDDMSGTGAFEFYRWWGDPVKLEPGEHDYVVSFNANQWSSVLGHGSMTQSAAFADALANAARIGVTFGSYTGWGHGVYATTSATFTMLDFDVVAQPVSP